MGSLPSQAPGLMPTPGARGSGVILGGCHQLSQAQDPTPALTCSSNLCSWHEQTANKWPEASEKGKRAPYHVPRKASECGLGVGWRQDRPAQGGHSVGLHAPPGGTPAPELFPQLIPEHLRTTLCKVWRVRDHNLHFATSSLSDLGGNQLQHSASVFLLHRGGRW